MLQERTRQGSMLDPGPEQADGSFAPKGPVELVPQAMDGSEFDLEAVRNLLTGVVLGYEAEDFFLSRGEVGLLVLGVACFPHT